MPAKDTIAAATEAQPVAAATAERASVAQFELELGPRQSARTQWPKITLVTTGKAFAGHSGMIQRNALASWTRLHADVEVILLGDDAGAAEVARELGLRHEPRVERNRFGSKRQDLRTRPWGYAAREIIDFLTRAGYCWFALTANSNLQPISTQLKTYDANLVALPEERADDIRKMMMEAKLHDTRLRGIDRAFDTWATGKQPTSGALLKQWRHRLGWPLL